MKRRYDSQPPGKDATKLSKAAVMQLGLVTTSRSEKAKRKADHINLPGAAGVKSTAFSMRSFTLGLLWTEFGLF